MSSEDINKTKKTGLKFNIDFLANIVLEIPRNFFIYIVDLLEEL